MDSQPLWRARESGSYRFYQKDERGDPPSFPRRADDRRGVHLLAQRFSPNLPRRARLQPEVEYGLDERHSEILLEGVGPPQIRTQQADVFATLRIYGKFHAFLLPRRGRARK